MRAFGLLGVDCRIAGLFSGPSPVRSLHERSVIEKRSLELDEQLRPELLIEDGTNEIHSQQMPRASIAIPFTHNFECFDPSIDVFNDDSLFRQITIEQLLLTPKS